MEILRQIIILLITVSASGFLLWHVVTGIKYGKIHYTRFNRICDRKEQPLFFWFLVILFLFFATVMLCVGIDALR